MRAEDKERVLVEVTSRVVQSRIRAAARGGPPLDHVLNDTLYHERKRLEREPDTPARRRDIAFWEEIQRSLARASEEELRELLRRVVQRYVLEIMGHFSEPMYHAATRVVPHALMGLLNGVSPQRLLHARTEFRRIEDTILIGGEAESFRRIARMGTVILAPTHSSHLDSPVAGWAIYHLGLPPFLYGAGLNLFHNPLVGFFLNRLGAYRVDRRKTAPLYKDTLKEYATFSLEIGYHNLFFPGGTRSRSGAVERKLKLGLLGTGLRAFIHNLRLHRPRPNVYVVPATISFPLVLEAETLIDDHLQREGKGRYIITDDEFSRPRRVLEFLKGVIQLDARIHIQFCPPLDVFGNRVDDHGRSLDARGRVIDVTRYVLTDEGYAHDPDRDAQYTRELGEAVAASFRAYNTAMTTHVVAFAVFQTYRRLAPHLDLFRLLRTRGGVDSLPLADVHQAVRALLERLRDADDSGRIRLTPLVRTGEVSDIVADALRLFGTYHTRPVLQRRGDRVFPEDMNLLYYYHNRLTGYGFEDALAALPRREAA